MHVHICMQYSCVFLYLRIERLSNPNQEKYRSEDIAESLSP